MRERVSLKGRSETSYACCRAPPPSPLLLPLPTAAIGFAIGHTSECNCQFGHACKQCQVQLKVSFATGFPLLRKMPALFSLLPLLRLSVRLSLRSVTHLTTFTVCPDLHNQFESVFGRISNQFRVKTLRILMQCPPADHLRISISISMDSRQQRQQ